MALAYLLDPTNQYQNVAGVNNVAGWFEVFISDTPERADVYVDFAGTLAPERIGIDNDGRAVMIVDSEGAYRVEMHAPNGDLLWTQYPVWPVGQGGGGAIGVDIGSSDGSIDVQRTQVGSVVNYDLSVAADGTDLLGWGEYVGYTMDGTHMVPSYSAGTIETGPHGIRLKGGQYYHVTVTLGASSVEQNVYDAFQVSFRGVDGDGVVSTFTTKSFHYDASTGEGHSYDVSFDMMPATDVEMYAEATGVESGISVGIAEVYVHRVYSGAPFVPGTVADKDWVEDNFQEKLVAGQNIVIEGNVISALGTYTQEQADWAQTDSEAASYIKNKPDLSVYATQTDLTNGLATKQDTISDLATIRSGAAAGATAVQDPNYVHTDNNFTNADATKLSGIEAGAEANVQANWNEGDSSSDAYIQNKPTIPSGAQLVPSATPSDAGEVLTVDSQGVPAWAPAQAPISAGDGIDITNNVVSAKVDGTTISVNLDGELVALGTGTDSAFLARYGTTTYQEIAAAVADNRAVFVTGSANALTAVMPMTSFNTNPAMVLFGTLIGSTEQTVKLDQGVWSCNYTGIQADWSETNQLKPSYINNKPIPKTLVAGSNITITEDSSTITVTATAEPQVNADWDASSGIAQILNKPDLSVYATDAELTAGLATKQDVISDLSTIRSGAAAGATAVQPGSLATVATSGSYNDLSNKPSIPAAQVNSDWNAVSGVAEILNKPSIPSGADLVPPYTLPADEGKVLTVGPSSAYWDTPKGGSVYYVTYGTTTWEQVQAAYAADNKVSFILLDENGVQISTTFELHNPTSSLGHIYFYQVRDTIPQAGIAITTYRLVFSGTHWSLSTYFVLSNVQADWAQTNSSYDSYIKNKPDLSVYAQTSSLATVATTGAYSDLTGTPAIPSGAQLVPAATSADADKVLTVDAQGTPAWSSAQAPISAGNGIDITNNVVSVDTSVVATQTDLTGKEDAFDVGTGLEMDTSGSTPTLQVEAPVDIVAGPGIVIDNPDGNTLRVSTNENYETVLYAGALPSFNNTITLSEPLSNFEYIDVSYSTTENPYITRYATALLGASRVAFKIGWGVNYMLDTWLKFTPTNDPKVWTYVNNTVMLLKNNDTSITILQNDTIYVTTSRTIRIVGVHRIAGGN